MGKLIVRDDLAEPMKAKTVLDEVYLVTRDNYNLREACRTVQTGDSLQVEVPVITDTVSGQMNVPELEEAEISSEAYDYIRSRLHKNVVHVALSHESQMESMMDIMTMNVQDAGREIARMENEEIATEMEGFTNTWDVSTENDEWDADEPGDPFYDIMEVAREIREENYEPNQLWLATDAYSALLSNEHVMERMQRGATADGTINTIAGFEIRTDHMIPSGEGYMLDSTAPAMMFFDGPEWIREYRDEVAFFDGYVIADFLGIQKVIEDAAYRLYNITE